MTFNETEQEVVDKLLKDSNYVNYIARLYNENKTFRAVAQNLKVDMDFFFRLFSEYPEVENRFNDALGVVSERESSRINSVAMPLGLSKVLGIIRSGEEIDERVILQAVALQLQYFTKNKASKRDSVEDAALDEIFKKLNAEALDG